MIKVDSQALGEVGRAFGLSGQGAGQTEFLDKELMQVVDVSNLIRRGRTPAATEGVFIAVIQNVHGAANTISTSVDPFNVTTGRLSPYPGPIPRDFDLWLLAANVTRNTGTGTMTAALRLTTPAGIQGWGIDDSGVAVVQTGTYPIVFWDALVTQTATFGLQDGRDPTFFRGIRMARGMGFNFTSTSSAIATYDCQLLLGLYPIGLGQDFLA